QRRASAPGARRCRDAAGRTRRRRSGARHAGSRASPADSGTNRLSDLAAAGTTGTTEVAWIAVGSNVGHRGLALSRLRDALETEGARIEHASSEIVTRPIGARAQGDFHNQVISVRSPEPWPATRWLTFCQNAERSAGRKPTYLWGPRVAD